MRLYFSVMLGVELKEGSRLTWEVPECARYARNDALGLTQSMSNQDIVQYVKDVLVDTSRHDSNLAWRVVEILEGSSIEVDGDHVIITMER